MELCKIGVSLKEGCNIEGAEQAIVFLKRDIHFKQIIEINPELLYKELPYNLSAVCDINLRLQTIIADTIKQGSFPLVYGGDHALAIGSISPWIDEHFGLIWIDAHGDCNTDESSLTHRIHGMPLAVLMGHGHPDLVALVKNKLLPSQILQIGIRSLDVKEKELMDTWGVKYLTMAEIRAMSMPDLLKITQGFVNDHQHIHISFDCDSMDPSVIRGVNTPAKGGFKIDEIEIVLKSILSSQKIDSMDIVEYNPLKDDGQTHALILQLSQMLEAYNEHR
jgi:arginase